MFRIVPEEQNLIGAMRKLRGKLAALRSDQHGTSAIEFAFFVGILSFGILNAADISIYIYKRMQVENATEMAVQAAWNNRSVRCIANVEIERAFERPAAGLNPRPGSD